QNAEHDQQFHTDQDHADTHTGLQRDLVAGERKAAQTGESGPRVGERIDADSVPRHAVASCNTEDAEQQNDDHLYGVKMLKEPEIKHDYHADKNLQNQEEFTLRKQVGLARLPDQFGDFAHGLMDRKIAQLAVGHQTEQKPERA